MPTIRKRGNKFHVQIRRMGFQTLTRSFSQRSDAAEWAREMESRADRRELPDSTRHLHGILLHDLLDRYGAEISPTKKGCRQEQYRIAVIKKHPLAKMSLATLASHHIASYRDHRLKKVKPSTVALELGLLQHALGVACREWGINLNQNAVRQVAKPKFNNRRDRRLEGDELDHLLSSCRQCRNEFMRPLIVLAVQTAMRRGELLETLWGHIDFTSRTLHIPEAKNGTPRTIPLTTVAVETLRNLQNSSKTEQVFPISAEAVKNSWQRLVRRAGVTNLTFHDLRHEAISRFFEMGLSVPEVALISGHKDMRMLFRYVHLRAQDLVGKLG